MNFHWTKQLTNNGGEKMKFHSHAIYLFNNNCLPALHSDHLHREHQIGEKKIFYCGSHILKIRIIELMSMYVGVVF